MHAPVENTMSGSTKPHCLAGKKPTKDHVGPHGKNRCVWGLVDSLQLCLCIEILVGIVSANHAESKQAISTLESRHAEELSLVEKFNEQKLDGLLKVVESF